MEYQIHKNIRNCGDQYPNASFATKGYQLGPISVFECPKTYIDKRTKSLIDAYDASQTLKIPFVQTMGELSPIYVEIAELIESERSQIRSQLSELRKACRG